jgi:hypothetical protein
MGGENLRPSAEEPQGSGGPQCDTKGVRVDPPNTEGPAVRRTAADSVEAERQMLEQERHALLAEVREMQEGKGSAAQNSPSIYQPLYMLIALGVVIGGLVLLALNGLEGSTATITLGNLASLLGGAIAGVTIPQALRR